MGRPYDDELRELPKTYQWATEVPVQSLSNAIRRALDLPLVAVGSGGSLTVANFAASLHGTLTGSSASAQTPLEAIASGFELRRFAVMLVTAGGGNPDVVGSFKHLASKEPCRLIVLCLRIGSPLAQHAKRFPFVDFIEFDAPWGRDGFLATNSLIASTVLLTRAYSAASDRNIELPKKWEKLIVDGDQSDVRKRVQVAWTRDTLVLLHGASTRAAAIDIESKFTEAALRNVWTADFRHFAHGRHHWLAKKPKTSAVLALITETDKALASATLALIPKDIPIVREHIPFAGMLSALAALARGIYITNCAGAAAGIDPGRPGVPAFGSRIYRINAFPSRSDIQSREDLAIVRKTRVSLERLPALDSWRNAYDKFLRKLVGTRFRGIVLDYDGTMCSDLDRYKPLREPILKELNRLLEGGITIGVATGRGKSVRQRLQEGLVPEYWPNVAIGYYNGGDIALLNDNSRPNGEEATSHSLRTVADLLRGHGLLNELASFEFRLPQIKVEPKRPQDTELVWDLIQQLVIAKGGEGTSLLRSSHSMDIVASGVSKLSVVKYVAQMVGDSSAPILCIGDRGRYPGNDYLLLGNSLGLSVDEAAPDIGSGWNLAPLGYRGVDACVNYLSSLKVTQTGARFVV